MHVVQLAPLSSGYSILFEDLPAERDGARVHEGAPAGGRGYSRTREELLGARGHQASDPAGGSVRLGPNPPGG
jgi:hypothetical protein